MHQSTVGTIALVSVFICTNLLWAQDAIKQDNAKPQKLCVALQHQYEPEPKSQEDAKQFFTFPFDLARQESPAADVDYSPDGKFLAFGMGWYNQGGWLAVWDLENDKEKFSVWLGLGIRSVQYSPDGKTIAVACFDQSAKVFAAESGKQIATLPLSNTNGTNSVSFSPDGRTIATGGLHAFVILWDTKTYRETMRLKGHQVRIYCAMYSPDGTMIASVDRDGLGIVWDAKTGEAISRLQGHQGGIETVDFTRDSQYVITGGWDGSVRFWDPQSGKENEDLRHVAHDGAMCLATSPDGKYVASSGIGDVIELFDYQNDETIRFSHDCRQQMYGLCFSPSGKEIASANFDGTVKRWSTDKQKLIDQIDMRHHAVEDPVSAPLAVAWSDDGKTIVSGHEDGSVRLRDPVNGSLQQQIDAHSAEVAAIAISPDGQRLASCGCDNAVGLWSLQDLKAGRNVQPAKLDGHTDWVVTCAFSPDSKWLATGSIDKTIRIWDATSGERVQVLTNHKSVVRQHKMSITSLDYAPSGNAFVSGSVDKRLCRWNAILMQSEAD